MGKIKLLPDGLGLLTDLPYREAKRLLLSEFDEAYFTEQLTLAGGNVCEAARRAGLDRSNFRRKMRVRE